MQSLNTEDLEYSWKSSGLLCFYLLAVLGLFLAGEYFYEVLAILGIATLLTYMLLGFVNRLEAFLKPTFSATLGRIPGIAHILNLRALSVAGVFITLITVLVSIWFIFFPLLQSQCDDLASDFPSYAKAIESRILAVARTPGAQVVIQSLPADEQGSKASSIPLSNGALVNNPVDRKILEVLSSRILPRLVSRVEEVFQKNRSETFGNLLHFATGTVEGILYSIVTLVVLFYFLLDAHALQEGVLLLTPVSWRQDVRQYLRETDVLLYRFTRGQMILAFLALMYFLTLYLFLGTKYALLLALFYGMCAVLPVIGPWIGLAPGVLTALLTHHPEQAVILCFAAGIFYVVKEYWLIRQISGTKFGVHPLTVIFSFIVCLEIAGISGVFVSFPLACFLSVVLHHLSVRKIPSPSPVV